MAIVSVAVPDAVPLMVMGLVAPKLKVGGSCAPLGPEVMAAVSATAPVKPLAGVTVTVETFPVVAPGEMVTAEAEILNVGGGSVIGWLTATVPEPVALV